MAYAIASAVITVLPGPSNLFLLAHGIGHGRRAALAALIGIETASAIRVVLTAAGLATVLASSATAFAVIRWAGVGYLTYLGIRAFQARHTGHAEDADQAATLAARSVPAGQSARKGLMTGLANPKMAIFFIAFLPQFVHPGHGSAAAQMLTLGAIFWSIGVPWDLALACASGTVGNWVRRRPRIQALQPRVEGITYLGLAGWAAVAGGHADR